MNGKEPEKEPCKPDEYALMGPQVEPEAGYWMYCARLRIVSIRELTAVTDDEKNVEHYFPPYPDPCDKKGAAQIKREIEELVELSKRRDDPCELAGEPKGKLGRRQPISKLLNLMPPALGAVMANRFPGEQIIRTGRGVARAMESETPGLFHRHALNYLISTRNWSPPRQALVWAALDVAIASALQAAWYYKWLSRRPLTSRRERPIEYAKRNGIRLNVLYDLPDELNPAYILCPDARKPNPMAPGTPRHPAYPSGHSTYAGAASEILSFFFGRQPAFAGAQPSRGAGMSSSDFRVELERMADNIGLGRLWAGIHWRTDHEAGVKLGKTVARLVLQQLFEMGINLCPPERQPVDPCEDQNVPCDMSKKPPTREQLEKEAKTFEDNCGKPKPQDPCEPPPQAKEVEDLIEINRSVQQGAQ
jgi:membrane-associated phospholipid phosphatase